MVPIVRTGDLTRPSTIQYGITPDTATAGVDYIGGNGTITMDVGVERVFIPVQILNDNLSEPTETFVVSIINVDSGSTLLFPRTARVDIRDDENPVVDPISPPLTSNYNVTQQVAISGLNQPLAFEFAPQNPSLVYVAEKGGVIKVFNVNTGAQQSTFIDISSKVNNNQDRGLLDIALDPNFGQPGHNYVYAFYVVDPPDAVGNPDPYAALDGAGNRFAYVVRFTADAATNYTTAVPGSEVILLGGAGRTLQDVSGAGRVDSTNDIGLPESGFNAQTGQYVDNYIKVDSRSHAGGSLAFGPDGALYVGIGDGTSFDTTDPRTVSVQNINSLSGKILRIDPITGLGLPDNPFVEPGDDLSANQSKVYQLGLRNPFSTAFTQDGRLLISNTGWFSWEEIESGNAGANFGWPYFEGGDNGVVLPAPGYQDLPRDPARNLPSAAEFYAAVANGTTTITPAYRAFAHDENAPGFSLGAIVGVDAPYSGSRYPAEFQNDVFFTDVNDGNVFVVDVNDRSDVKFLYNTGAAPVAFGQGPDGYVYAANLGGNTITRLLIAPTQVLPPNIALTPHGSASVANNVFTLTTAGTNQAGTAMSTGRIDVRQNFTVAFDVNLGASDAGADGAAFVLHNDPRGANAVGSLGSGLGVGGIQNGLAIEFDTYQSSAAGLADTGMHGSDIASDHTGFFGTNSTFTSTPVALPNIEDGAWHPVVVTWNAATQTLSYTFDGQPRGTLTGNVATQFLGGSNFAYVGFGAGTGGLGNIQSVRNVNVAATFEGQTPGNNPPVAVNDSATTAAGTAVNIAVLANDSDPESNPLTVTGVSNLVGGTATVQGNNTVTYTPTAGFSGAGGFTYTISDGTTPRSAQVSVTVTPPPGAVTLTPHGSATVANNVFTLTTAGTNQAGTAMSTGRIDVRQNFTVAFDVNLGASDAGADGAAFVLHNDPRGANAVGSLGSGLGVGGIQNGLAIEFDTYQSSAAGLADTGMHGSDIASDHTGFFGTNSAFTSTPVALPNIEDGAWHPVVVTWNAATQTLSYTFDGQQRGTLTGNVATQFLGGSNFAYVGFGAGTGGLGNIQSVRNVNVAATFEGQTPGNNPPVAVNDSATTAAGTAVNIAVLANDSDPESNPLTVTGVSNLVGGTATVQGNNTVTYTPTAGFSGAGGFTYTISDGTTPRSAQVSVTVTPPGNNPPVAVNDTATTAAGTAVNIAVLANDSDPESNPLTVTGVSNLVGGTATVQGNNTVTYTPTAGFSGAGGFTYTISDGTTPRSAQVSVTVTPPPGAVTLTPHGSATVANNVFTLTTAGTNQAGTAMSTGRIDVRQNFSVAFDVNLGASDAGADGAAFVLHNDPRGANAVGSLGSGLGVGGIQNGLAIEFDTYQSSAAGLADTGMHGSDIASDHTGFFGTNSTFTSTPVALPNIEDGAWHPVVVTWNAATQTLSYTFDGQQRGTLTGNVATQFLGGSNFAYVGFGAGTGGLGNVQSVRNVNVAATFEGQTPGNNPPVAVNDSATTAAGTAVNIAVLANDSDPESNPLTVTGVSNLVGGTATVQGNNTVTYTPTAGFSGAGGFTYTISDGTTPRSAQVSVTVTPPPGAVTLTPHGSATVANNVFTLTTAGTNQAGTAMSTGRIDVRQNFSVAFDVNLGASDAGADGAAFVLHNDPRGANAVGSLGSGLGVGGIQNGLAIEFDTYQSSAAGLADTGMHGSDIASDHTGFFGTNSTFTSTPVALPNIEDGAWHPVVVTWNAATQTLSYTFDGQQRGTLTGNVATQFLGGSNFAYVGFGAGTGGLGNVQSVRNVNVAATLEGQTAALLAIESDPTAIL